MWRITIEALPPSLNKFYSGMHWAQMMKVRDEWHGLFLAAFKDAKLPKPLVTPLNLHVTQFCKGIVRDSDNAVIAAKFCADALRLHGYIPDDTPEFIPTVILTSKKSTDKINRLVILISSATV